MTIEKINSLRPKGLLALMGLFLVCGCGGSGGGGGSAAGTVSLDASAVRVFADASGVARLVAVSSEGTSTGYMLTPELALVLEQFEVTGEVPVDNSDLTVIPVDGAGPNTVIRRGAIEVDGVVVNVTGAVTTAEDAGLIFLEEPTFGDSLLISLGEEAINMPTSGSASYEGIFGMQDFSADGDPEIGAFTATANFTNSMLDFDGETDSFSAIGTAVISDGSFNSSNITIADQPLGVVATGSMNGDFHGLNANSMAGVVYSNDDFADYRGGFVGSQ